LDENEIRNIVSLREKQEKIWKLKNTAINTIDEMGKLTPELLENIIKATTLKEVEEIYKPYKSKKKTKAMIAIEKGFQVIADYIKNGQEFKNTSDFKELLEINSETEIIDGSKEIIAAEIVADSDIREYLRTYLQKKSLVVSKVK